MAGTLTLDCWPGPSGFTTASYFDRFKEQMQFGMPGAPGVLPYHANDILGTYTNELRVFADSSGMQVKVYQGRATAAGVFAKIPDASVSGGVYTLTVTTAHATLQRIDRVVIRFDLSNGGATLRMVDGTAATTGTAVPPALTQSATTWDVPLALVMVDAAAVTIAVADVFDARVFSYTARSLMEALAIANPIINGGMDVWQRGTTFTSVADGAYMADRWRYGKAGAIVHDGKQTADVPAVAETVQKDNYCLHLDVTTADSSIASGDFSFAEQRIEGRRIKRLLQRGFTIPFWVKDTIIGPHAVAFVNSGGDRSCVVQYFIEAADTWQLCFAHVPASPTAGTWDYTNGIGLRVVFAQAVGSTFWATTPGSWETGLFYGTSRTANSNSSTSNNFKLWGVGPARLGGLVMPFSPHDNELALCQEYYWKTFLQATAPAQNAGTNGALNCTIKSNGDLGVVSVVFPVVMRGTPVVTTYNPSAANANWTEGGTANALDVADRGFNIQASGSTVAGSRPGIHAQAVAEL